MEDFKLKVFRTVYSAGSFTKAAGLLGISQPAVSQNISDIEKDLGCKLFERLSGRIMPTPQGDLLKRCSDRIDSAYKSLNTLFRPGIPAGQYHVYADPVSEVCLLTQILEFLHNIHPEINLVKAEDMGRADVLIMSASQPQSDAGLSFTFTALPEAAPLSKLISAIIGEILK